MQKPLTCEAVVRAAEVLMARHGRTTATAVHRRLHTDGYYAVAPDVAYLMDHLALIEGWAWSDRGERTYAPAHAADTALSRCYVLHLN